MLVVGSTPVYDIMSYQENTWASVFTYLRLHEAISQEIFIGVLQIFYRGTDNGLYTRWRSHYGGWSNEQQIGGVLEGDPVAAVVPGTNILQLFYRGANSAVWSRWRNPDGSWSAEQQIGGVPVGDPVVAAIPD